MTTHKQLIALGFVLIEQKTNSKTYLHRIYMDDIKVNVLKKQNKERIDIVSRLYNGSVKDVESIKDILDRIYNV